MKGRSKPIIFSAVRLSQCISQDSLKMEQKYLLSALLKIDSHQHTGGIPFYSRACRGMH